MLFTLSGIAQIHNVRAKDSGHVSLQVVFSSEQTHTSGSRWINLSREQSEKFLDEHKEPQSAQGCLVHVTASAYTMGSNSQNSTYEEYRANTFQILGSAKLSSVDKNIVLSGTGKINSIERVTSRLARILVCSGESHRNNRQYTCERFITVSGNVAKWFADQGDKLIGREVEFKAQATTVKQEREGGQKTYYRNYLASNTHVLPA